MKNTVTLVQEHVDSIVSGGRPDRLLGPGKHPIAGDHAAHVVQLAGWGQTTLAADHLLFPELNGALPGIVGGVIRQLNIEFVARAYSAG